MSPLNDQTLNQKPNGVSFMERGVGSLEINYYYYIKKIGLDSQAMTSIPSPTFYN